MQTKIWLGLMAAFCLFALGLSVWGLLSLTPATFVALGISIVIAAVFSQHETRLPNSRLPFSARQVLTLWGTIWLGVPGGVILSLTSSVAAYKLHSENKGRWLAGLLSSIIAAFVSAKVFYWLLRSAGSLAPTAQFASESGLIWLIPATLLLAAIGFAVYTTLLTIFLRAEGETAENGTSFLALFKDIATGSFLNYQLGAVGALLFHLLYAAFGLWFGLFLLPLVVAGHIAYRLHLQKFAEKTKELTESNRIHLATVEALATAIDARDQVGVGHVRRTQIYAVGIGEALSLDANQINALKTGALMHDIGKLGVPDHILNKRGTLTSAERMKMQIHATVGAAILEKVKFPYPVAETVRYHHESWDGSGYPEGLKKDEIPLTARIISVADAYDTLRGARPLGQPMTREEARRSLLNDAGSRLDPKIVDVFLHNLSRFELEIEEQGLSYEFDVETSELYLGVEGATEENQSYVEQIKRANREVFALYESAKVFSASLNLQDTLSQYVKKISELMPFDTCAVYLLNKSQGIAKIECAEGFNCESLIGKVIAPGEGATGFVLKNRQSVCNVSPALDFAFDQLESVGDYTTMVSFPLLAGDHLIGATSLYSCGLESYEDEHMRLLETVSRIASDAILKSLYHAETETHALTDALTNLPNARSLQIQFENEAARANRSATQFQLLMLDLDGFKKVNDTFGHKAGDRLLKEIAKVMRGQLREYDFLARYAGDEFVAIVPETTVETVQELCERMEKAVLNFRLPVSDGKYASVGVSIGAAGYPGKGDTLDQVIIAADQAMYSVKAARKRAAKKAVAAEMKINEDAFVVELDESHIISTAVN